ncbi:hypothetical protein G7046_g135 [Stylonectria norvegica]|nr:hypothetical protein G7046_g135 [Stylonectria norvegica]
MLVLLPLAIFGISKALAQASYGDDNGNGTPPFKYWGCASVDPAGFSDPIPLPHGILNPVACQAACAGQLFAAVSPTACRCGNDKTAVISVDESSCNYPCTGGPDSGMCGGNCPEKGPVYNNVFTTDIVWVPGDPPTGFPISSITASTPPLSTIPPPKKASSVLPTGFTKVPTGPSNAPSSIPPNSVPPSSTKPTRPNATSPSRGNSPPGGNSWPDNRRPVPSQVQGSDSNIVEIPVLAALGELLLLAGMAL